MTKLFPYQEQAIAGINQKFREGFMRPLLVLGTGGGKSTVASAYSKILKKHDKKMWFVVHKEELVLQFRDRLLQQFGITSSIIMASHKTDWKNDFQVCSKDTLIRRDITFSPDVIFIDEAHRAYSKGYREKVIDKHPTARIIGLTATPFRGDRKPLGDIYDSIVHPIKMHELIKMGRLVGAEYYIPDQMPDFSGLKLKFSASWGKDYDQSEVFSLMDEEKYYRKVVEEWRGKTNGELKTIVFNTDRVKHSEKMNEWFLEYGYKSVHIDGKTSKSDRRKYNKWFRTGEVQILNNCSIFVEGYDVPDCECVILNRKIGSEGLYVQAVGRGLRSAPNKTKCTVLDFGANALKFGFAEDYDLEGFELQKTKDKKKGNAPMKQCECGAVNYASAKLCTVCGLMFPIKQKENSSLDFGEMVLLEKDEKKLGILSRKYYKKVKAHELRAYALQKGYSRMWYYYQAIEKGIVKIQDGKNLTFKEVDHQLALIELEKNYFLVYKLTNEGYTYKGEKQNAA